MIKKPANRISILMPVKNAGSYLIDCLDSISRQSETDWELIAIDDHSTDDSYQILYQFALSDPRIQVFRNDGTGIIAALRLALKKAVGKLITRMDADDIMPPHKLEILKQQLIKAGPGHLSCGLVEYFSDTTLGDGYQRYADWLNQLFLSDNSFLSIYQECVIPSPCWMVFREDLLRCGAFEADRYPEDYDLCFRFYEKKLKIIASSEILHRWRDHASRSSRNDPNYADNRFLELKVHHFLRIDHQPERPLLIWGAGKKGKRLAALLSERKISFHWITNNPKKIGHIISGTKLEAQKALPLYPNPQLLICIAAPDEQHAIQAFLSQNSLQPQQHYFFFC